MTEMGERIEKSIKDLGISQAEFCRRSGLTEVYICNLKAGRHYPRLDTLMILSEGLGVSLDYLVYGKE